MLSLSLLSDAITRYIKRHAVHVGRYAVMERPRWIMWGTRERGWMLPRPTGRKTAWGDEEVEMVEHFPKFFVVRVPGWYWEPQYDIARDRCREGWCHKYLYW